MKFRHYFRYSDDRTPPRRWQKTSEETREADLPNGLRKDDAHAPLGIALQPDELVVDIDPRNGGEDSFKRLCDALGIKEWDSYPIVITGRGGRHYYFTKDPSVKIRTKLKKYRGIEFLSKGANVVAAGSRFKNTNRFYSEADREQYGESLGVYEYDLLSLSIETATEAPPALISLIKKEVRENLLPASSASLTEIRWGLSKIDPVNFRDYEPWRNLMFSIKAASHGHLAAKALFLQWCAQDTKYRHDTPSVEKLWDAASSDRSSGITERTFIKIIKDSGASINEMLVLSEEMGVPDSKVPTGQLALQTDKPCSATLPSNAMWVDIYYVAAWGAFYHINTRTEIKKEAFNVLFRDGDNKAADKFLDSKVTLKRRAVGCKYEPYYPIMYDLAGVPFLNRWTGNDSKRDKTVSEDDIRPWFDHIDFMFKDNETYSALYHEYLCALFQKKRRRLNFAMVIYSMHEGVGKTTPLKRLLDLRFNWQNVGILSNSVLTSSFNASITDSEVVILEDAKSTGRFEIINKMKPWITDEYIERHPKGKDAETVKNFASYIIFTNNADALAITQTDRRFLVLESTAKPPPKAYFPKFLKWLRENGEKVVAYYVSKEIDFDSFCQRAPRTEAAEKMRDEAMPAYAKAVREVLLENEIPYSSLFILSNTFYDTYFRKSATDNSKLNPKYGKSFHHLGYIYSERLRVPIGNKQTKRLTLRLKSMPTKVDIEMRTKQAEMQYKKLTGLKIETLQSESALK